MKIIRSLSFWVCFFLFSVNLIITVFGGKWKKNKVLISDVAGYYHYLPAVFIYKDISFCKWYGAIDSVYNPGNNTRYYSVQYHPQTKKFYFKYTYGTALVEMPAFFIAHGFMLLFCPENADGYSPFYQLAIALNSILFGFLGLLVLRKWLLFFFDEKITALVIILIGAGTNYFAQQVTQPGLTHVYLFFLYALSLYTFKKWENTSKIYYLLFLFPFLTLAFLIRPVSVVFLLFPIFYLVFNSTLFQQFKKSIFSNPYKICITILVCCFFIFIQMLYWKYTTDHWYFYTYKREKFFWSQWEIMNGLFSFRKGWFVYTPIAAVGLISLLWMKKEDRFASYKTATLIYFSVVLYVTFCWWQWYYGGSFGCRPLVESLVFLALPLGVFLEKVFERNTLIKFSVFLFLILCIGLNIFQTAQFAKGIIHWQKMNREYYLKVFLKWKVSEDEKKLLNSTEELTI